MMKKDKVLSDLSSLLSYIENGHVTIESYEYSFINREEIDYGEFAEGNEKIRIEWSWNEGKANGLQSDHSTRG